MHPCILAANFAQGLCAAHMVWGFLRLQCDELLCVCGGPATMLGAYLCDSADLVPVTATQLHWVQPETLPLQAVVAGLGC
jgi:hypothetical protein